MQPDSTPDCDNYGQKNYARYGLQRMAIDGVRNDENRKKFFRVV
jgi:hypothetical protein